MPSLLFGRFRPRKRADARRESPDQDGIRERTVERPQATARREGGPPLSLKARKSSVTPRISAMAPTDTTSRIDFWLKEPATQKAIAISTMPIVSWSHQSSNWLFVSAATVTSKIPLKR